jgi:hypothetical protein
MVGDPEVELNQDTDLVLDARQATEVVANTAKPTEAKQTVFGYYRAGAQLGSWESLFLVGPPINRVFAAPTEQVTKGDFGFRAKPTLAAPELEIAIAPPNAMDLDAIYAFGSPEGRRQQAAGSRLRRIRTRAGLPGTGRPRKGRAHDPRPAAAGRQPDQLRGEGRQCDRRGSRTGDHP